MNVSRILTLHEAALVADEKTEDEWREGRIQYLVGLLRENRKDHGILIEEIMAVIGEEGFITNGELREMLEGNELL